MLTKEQLELRKKCITGTDASIIAGINPYESIYDLWCEKKGYSPGKNLDNNPYVLAGRFLEDGVRKLFEHATGKEVSAINEMQFNKDYHWMAANIDGWIEEERAVVEIKTARGGSGWGEQGQERIPDHYLCQVAHYMAVMDAKCAYVAVLIGGHDFRWYRINRNKGLEEKLIALEKDFYENHLMTEQAPNARNMSDVIKMFSTLKDDENAIADSNAEQLVEELKEIKATMKRLKEKEEIIKSKIALFMLDKTVLLSRAGDVILTFKETKGRKTFDTTALKELKPEIYNEFSKVSEPSRRMLVKGE